MSWCLTNPICSHVHLFSLHLRHIRVRKRKKKLHMRKYMGSSNEGDVVWFEQTINNACSLYSILHALCNGEARQFISNSPRGFLYKLTTCRARIPFSNSFRNLPASKTARACPHFRKLWRACVGLCGSRNQGRHLSANKPRRGGWFPLCLLRQVQEFSYIWTGWRSERANRQWSRARSGWWHISENSLGIVREFIQRRVEIQV